MEFTYQARDNQGVLHEGNVEAVSESAASDILQQHNLFVIRIIAIHKSDLVESINIFNRVSPKDIVLFSRQLATLIGAKVPIIQALRILQNQVSSRRLKKIVGEISLRISSGDSLSSALARYPKVFSNLYVSLIRSGELSGSLENSLGYLANQLEKDYDLRSKVLGAMTYPVFIVVALFIVGIMMFLYVLPPLVSILKESGVELPITTKILIATTNVVQHFWWIFIVIVIVGGGGYRYYSQTAPGRYLIDGLKMKLPVFGSLFVRIYMARFARNLGTLIAGGIPIVKALESVADMVSNQVYREIIFESASQVRNGKSIASVLNSRVEFPPIVAQMTEIGESTGQLQQILEKLAEFYEKEVDGELRILTTLMEPVVMIILGLAVAVMVAGILLPIYNLASAA